MWGWFKNLGKLVKKGIQGASSFGLTDEILGTALIWVRVASKKYEKNDEKREFVVEILKKGGVPEVVARLAVELAVIIFKRDVKNVPL
jgi:hypothetical protein